MLKTQTFLYAAVLLFAFAAGLVGTLAATRYVTQLSEADVGRLERPVSSPFPSPTSHHVPTVDC